MIEGEPSSRALSGGDLGRARWVETTSGPVVEKTHPPSVPAALVEAEAAGPAWLTVDGGPPVPRVRSHDGATIVVDAVHEGGPDTPRRRHVRGRALFGAPELPRVFAAYAAAARRRPAVPALRSPLT